MTDHQVYLEKMSVFSRMLRLQGLPVSPKETEDACRIEHHISDETIAMIQKHLTDYGN